MEVALLLIILIFGGIYASNMYFLYFREKHFQKKQEEMRYLHIKVLLEFQTDQSSKSANIQNYKQNIEVMNQFLKNIVSIVWQDKNDKKYGDNYISLEVIGRNESIEFILWWPKKYLIYIEQNIWSFYPWCTVDYIKQPKLLEEGMYAGGWYITLAKKYQLPLKTYEHFEVDPIDSIFSSFSKITSLEKLSIQYIITPLSENVNNKDRKNSEEIKKGKMETGGVKKVFNFITSLFKNPSWSDKKDKDKDKEKDDKYLYNTQQCSDIDKKIDEELFSVQIRVLATSPNPDRPDIMISDVTRSLWQYTYSWLNSLQFKKTTNLEEFMMDFVSRNCRFVKDKSFKTKDLFRSYYLQNPNISEYSNVLGMKEISSLYHFPSNKFNKNPRIKYQKYKVVPAPDNLPTQWLLIWYNIYGGVHKEVRIQDEDRFRHFYCIWQTGTGKTTALLVMAKDDLANGRWFCFIDPHGDFCEKLLEHFPKERIDDLIYFNVADFNNPIWFNVLQWETQEERDVIISDLIDMFVSMYGHEIFGPRIQDYFRNACYCLMEQPDGGTISEIVRLFVDPAFNKIKVSNVKNPIVRWRWDKTYNSMWDREKAEMIPYFQAKFSPFTDSGIVRNIVGQPQSSFNMFDIMQQKKVLIVNLSKWLLGEENSKLIGRFISTQIKVNTLKRASINEPDRVPFYLYVDEFQNYVSASFESILSEARKYKLWLAVAHQYIDQLKTSGLGWWLDLSKAIFGNVGTMMSYKVGAPDAEFLEKEYSPEFTQTDLVNMDKFKWVIKLSVNTQPTRPFSVNILNPYTAPLNSPERVNKMKQISALKRGRERELVEKEVFYRVGA